MTLIQPSRHSSLQNWILTGLVMAFIFSAVSVVFLYNRLVNLDHSAAKMKLEVQKIETANAELKESIFNLLDSNKFETFASERGLVKEQEPNYFEIGSAWALASQY